MTSGATQIWAIARKELRGYFNSAVALIFLATFLLVTLFTVFWVEKFLVRGIADVRPLFEWLPILLIFLVAALTMRLWSEEQKVGTIEILLTLPVPLHRLVLGKFLAGLILVALALALTFGIPITVSMMGNLDWGPVFGGYFAALLVAAAYLGIGLCVSAATDNQIVSLVTTCAICALLYIPGMAAVSTSFGYGGVRFLEQLGTGSRFQSVARGVFDLRDLAYWGGMIAFTLLLNTIMLHAKRWSAGQRTARARTSAKLSTLLVAANVIALNVWLSPVTSARVDMTEDGAYGLSDVTEKLISELDEPLLIRGYFSEKSHPLLTPLVPRIRDVLEEYRIASKSKVRVEIVDPTKDEAVEKEAHQAYAIESVPFRFSDRREESVVNAYFHVLVSYGDQYEVLDFSDLVEVRPGTDTGEIEVQLNNLEYQLTRSIKKLAYGFKSTDSLYASLRTGGELVFVTSPDTIPEQFKALSPVIEKAGNDIATASGGKLKFVTVTPKLTKDEVVAIYNKYGIQPTASVLDQNAYYFHLLLKIGDDTELVVINQEVSEASAREAVETSLRRMTPGFLKTVGVVAPPQEMALSPHGGPPQQGRPAQMFEEMARRLSENYSVENVSLTEAVPDDINVLILAGPANLEEAAARNVDQFVMRGGSLLVFAGHRLDIDARDLVIEKVPTGLDKVLASYGFEIQDVLVADDHSSAFPIPVTRDLGGLKVRDVQLMPYPYFPRIDGEQLAEGHPVTASVKQVVLQWPSPVKFTPPAVPEGTGGKPPQAVVLLSSSKDAWTQANIEVKPDFTLFPGSGFGKPKTREGEPPPYKLAIAATGSFSSSFKSAAGDKTATLESSPPDARVVVVGSSVFASDEATQMSQRDEFESNLQFVQNLVDWSVEDTDLLTIRARGTRMRRLEVEEDSRGKWEVINYAIAILALGAVIAVSALRRRSLAQAVAFGDARDDEDEDRDEAEQGESGEDESEEDGDEEESK